MLLVAPLAAGGGTGEGRRLHHSGILWFTLDNASPEAAKASAAWLAAELSGSSAAADGGGGASIGRSDTLAACLHQPPQLP